MTDLMGGQGDLMIDPVASSAQYVKAGKLRALAVSSARRSPLAPELATMSEAGLPGYDFSSWFLVLAPAGTPPAVVDKLNAQIGRILRQPDVQERYKALGAEPGNGTPQELVAFVDREIQRFARVLKDAGMKAE